MYMFCTLYSSSWPAFCCFCANVSYLYIVSKAYIQLTLILTPYGFKDSGDARVNDPASFVTQPELENIISVDPLGFGSI